MTESKNIVNTEDVPSNDFKALGKHIKENPLMYAGSIGFVVLCAVVSLLYRLNTEYSNRDAAAVYAQALDAETPQERVDALDLAMEDTGTYAPLALYMKGESAFQNQDYETAQASFLQLREEHSDFEFVPDAVEGLGYIMEDQGNLEGALAKYKEIVATWPESFAGRRQGLNIGRCQEKLGNMEAAIAGFRDQLTVFPNSNVAIRAQIELNRLRSSHPDLFEDENMALELDSAVEVESALDTIVLDTPE